MTDRLTPIPSAFPFEGPEYAIPRTRPPRRRLDLDDWELDAFADATLPNLEADLGIDPGDTPTIPAHDPGDTITRIVLAVWLACTIVALLAGIGYHERSGPWVTGAFLVALATSAGGWAAYRITDRKTVR